MSYTINALSGKTPAETGAASRSCLFFRQSSIYSAILTWPLSSFPGKSECVGQFIKIQQVTALDR